MSVCREHFDYKYSRKKFINYKYRKMKKDLKKNHIQLKRINHPKC